MDSEQRMTTAAQNDEVSAMLIVRSGSIKNGLCALLKSIASISRIEITEDPVAGLEWVSTWQPHLAIIAGNGFGDQVSSLLMSSKRRSPTTCFMLFAENLPDAMGAEELEVEAVVQQGTHPDDLARLIESLVQEAIKKKGDGKNE